MNNLENLIKIGFVLVGEWKHSIKSNKVLEFVIFEHHNESDILYAFESNGEIYYIGKTEKTLKERMTNYKAGKNSTAGSTNKLIHNNLLMFLNEGRQINIHILIDNAKLSYRGIKISLSSGLESNLIKSFNNFQLWNSRSVNTTEKKIENLELIKNKSNVFELKLSKEYYEKGVISIPKKLKNVVLDTSGVQVKLRFEDVKNELFATYTFSGENRKINGKGELKDWFSKNFKLNDYVKIEIISPKEFKLYKGRL